MISKPDPEKRKQNILAWFFTLYVILRSGVVYVQSLGNTFVFIDIGVAILGTVILINQKIRLEKKVVILFVWMVVWLIFIAVIHDDEAFLVYLAMSLSLYIALVATTLVSFEDFKRIFIYIVVFLAVASLGFYFLREPLMSLYRSFNIISTSRFAQYHNLWVWIMHVDTVDRNFGVFWEPGAFQVFLNLALIFVLHNTKFSTAIKGILAIVLSLAVVTTFSTTGYIVLALVYASLLLRNSNRFTTRQFGTIVVGMAILVPASIVFIVNNETVSSKFDEEGLSRGSFVDRYNATLLDVEMMNQNIFFGVGAGNYLAARDIQTEITGLDAITTPNTYSQLGATFGTFALLIYALIHARFAWSITTNVFEFAVIVGIIALLFSTENFLYHKLAHMLFWYGVLLAPRINAPMRVAMVKGELHAEGIS